LAAGERPFDVAGNVVVFAHMAPYWEERLGSIVAGGGIAWAAAAATHHLEGFNGILFASGPLEICGIGILVWLHAKWRRSTSAK